jgi:hypothetical protein
MTTLVQSCMPDDFDAATQTCAAPTWMVYEGAWPPLSMEDAQLIGGKIALLLVVAWSLKKLAKFLEQI